MLGNNSFADILNREHLEKVHKEIILSHRDDCNECVNNTCNRLIFAECNLSTGSNREECLKKFTKALIDSTPKFLSVMVRYSGNVGSQSDFEMWSGEADYQK